MNVLIVASNNQNSFAPFIIEQVEALRDQGIICEYFGIKGKSFIGYLKNFSRLKRKINEFQPHLIHAHYGLSGLLANFQRKIPVVTTYHGSDVNSRLIYPFSFLSIVLSRYNIFVKRDKRILFKKKSIIIPCGVDLDVFRPLNKEEIRQELELKQNQNYVLFSSSFENKIKNPALALMALKNIPNTILLELKGYSRNEVAYLMNAADIALLTSYSEGSPQFIKEAMACNKPIVATNVGNIEWLFGDEPGHFLTSFNPEDVAEKIQLALKYSHEIESSNGRQRIIDLHLDSESVAKQIINVYKSVIK